MSTFASTLSSLASTASKRAFISAISGEHPHVVDVGVHGVVLSAVMPLSRQEATRHLRRRLPLRLERLPAWSMRGESRFCEQNIGREGGVGREAELLRVACRRAGERRGGRHKRWCAETPGMELWEQVCGGMVPGVRGRGGGARRGLRGLRELWVGVSFSPASTAGDAKSRFSNLQEKQAAVAYMTANLQIFYAVTLTHHGAVTGVKMRAVRRLTRAGASPASTSKALCEE